MFRACLILLAIAASVALVSACGDDNEEPAGLEHELHVHLDEWSVETEPGSVAAGTVNIGGHNHGKYPHQVTAIKTDLDSAELPISKARVDIEAIGDPAVEFDVPAAEGGEGLQVATAELTPGRYVIFCAIPGHYQQGMRGALEVTSAPSP